ncbi:MAG: alpha-ketoglutarate-dependent dioxygenase AlkB [Bacteroidota bacterium]
MDLFNQDTTQNRLPYEGEVIYYGPIFSPQEAEHYRAVLLDKIAWKPDEAIMFGKHILTKRKVAWYGDAPYSYTYSQRTRQALLWTSELLEINEKVESLLAHRYNSCLLNLYHNGEEGMAWHSDDEKDLGPTPNIASLSFGAERRFLFKHKESKEKVALVLERGSLLVMKGLTQQHWLHRLPPSKKVHSPRINLTFRTMYT